MSSIYTPGMAALINLLLPSDGDLRNVASVNGPLKKLADAIMFNQTHPMILEKFEVVDTSLIDFGLSGTIVAPSTCTAAIVSGWGPGGKGGRGGVAPIQAGEGRQSVGGGGGGGAIASIDVVPILPGGVHAWAVGGYAGGSSYLRNPGGAYLFRSFQAEDGGGDTPAVESGDFAANYNTGPASDQTVGQALYGFQHGGAPVMRRDVGGFLGARPAFVLPRKMIGLCMHSCAQQGGFGTSANVQNDSGTAFPFGQGCASPQGYQGGDPGVAGANFDGLYRGGGAGGGGGAGPGGEGGKGGNGGAGVGSGVPGNGTNGVNAPAGSGAGGGGGGAVGASADADTFPGTPGEGGRPGGGTLRIWFLRMAP